MYEEIICDCNHDFALDGEGNSALDRQGIFIITLKLNYEQTPDILCLIPLLIHILQASHSSCYRSSKFVL